MKIPKNILLGFLTSAFCIEAIAHGMTAEMQAVFTLALVEKCQDDQPTISRQLEAAQSEWSDRNKQPVSAAKALPEKELRSAKQMAREAYDQEGAYSIKVCQKLLESLRDPESDIKPD